MRKGEDARVGGRFLSEGSVVPEVLSDHLARYVGGARRDYGEGEALADLPGYTG